MPFAYFSSQTVLNAGAFFDNGGKPVESLMAELTVKVLSKDLPFIVVLLFTFS